MARTIRSKPSAKSSSRAACESPKLLLLSGIGPKAALSQFNIPLVVDSPHVGQNLRDHPILSHVFRLKDGFGLDNHILRAGLEKDGAVSANGGRDAFGPAGQPHFEIDCVPLFADAFQWHIPAPPKGDHMTVIVDLLRPVSKTGTVTLASADPLDDPKVNLNFLESDLDLIALREGVRWVDDILMTGDGMKDIVEGDYPWPMPRHSDEAMNQLILERSQTGFRKLTLDYHHSAAPSWRLRLTVRPCRSLWNRTSKQRHQPRCR
jgi:choline dehydrogenase-like flavoprotein